VCSFVKTVVASIFILFGRRLDHRIVDVADDANLALARESKFAVVLAEFATRFQKLQAELVPHIRFAFSPGLIQY
jgi:hypothetical protein